MVKQYNPQQTTGKAISRGHFTKQARSLQVTLDFTNDTQINVTLPAYQGIQNQAGIDNPQSIWIDNSNNAQNVVLVFDNQFQITCPAFAIGIFPLLISGQGINFIATSTGAVELNTWFTNTREQPAIWSAKFPLSGTINVTGSIINASVPPVSYTDRTAVLPAAASTQIMAANGNRVGFVIKNAATPNGQGIAAPEPVYINWGAAAAVGTYELLPGEAVTAEGLGGVSTQAINAYAATVGHILVAKEF